jgi:outer membrane protein assembly factor BamB
MHIKTVCPRCESSYQVDPGLKGKRMRCPNPLCRAVFEVRDADQAPPAPPPAPTPPPSLPVRSGTVGDVVPVLTGEAVAPIPRAQPAAPPAPKPPDPMDDFFAGASPVSGAAPEAAIAAWEEGPPVRQGITDATPAPEANGLAYMAPFAAADVAEHAPSRRHRWTLALLVLLMLGAVGGIVWLMNAEPPTDEAERLARAEKEYKDRNFDEAANLFKSLVHDFPQSEERTRYQFLAELSEIRNAVYRTQTDVEETREHDRRINKFLEIYGNDPLLEKYYEDVGDSKFRLAEELAGFAARTKNRQLLEEAKKVSAGAAKLKKQGLGVDQKKVLDALFAEAEEKVKKAETRAEMLAKLKEFTEAPSLDAVEQAPALVQQAGLADDSEVKTLLDALPAEHRKSIKFIPGIADALGDVETDRPPSLAVLLSRGKRAPAEDSGGRSVLALVRGVLYALDPLTGTPRWQRRVGVDTALLPTWLPASPVAPETVLVCSPEAGGLLALDGRDGSVRWCQVLPEPCTGKPLIVGGMALVAGRGGTVYQIEVVGGRRLGGWRLGVPLTHGGVLQPETNLVYFAADRGCLFVLDAEKRTCEHILYTGHPSGSLRCLPIILPLARGDVFDPAKAGPPQARLLVCWEDGSRATQLNSWLLPLTDPRAKPADLGSKLPGRVWFPPLQTPEAFGLVTDAGAFAVFGVRQRDNQDADLFPMHRETLTGKGTRPQVVHADSQNFWVVIEGRLHRFRVSLTAQQGWKLVPAAAPGAALGSNLHTVQVQPDDQGATVGYFVTETLDGRACRLTAVDMDRGELRWQRQLGLVCHGQPLVLDGKALAWDRAGGLFLFDADKTMHLPGGWQAAGKVLLDADDKTTWLLPHPDLKSATVLVLQGKQVARWHYADGRVAAQGNLALPSAAAGNPVLVGDAVVLPLADGRLALLRGDKVEVDAIWRSGQADKSASCHVAAIGPNKVACSDGGNGMKLWRLDDKGLAELKAAAVKGRILAPPAVLGEAGEFGLVVADGNRVVTLFRGDDLRKAQEWVMREAITAGPFVRGDGIGVVVGKRRLVWLDRLKDQPLWATSFRADIVGQPQLIDGLLIVADETGDLQALDPAMGRAVGLGYTLRADVAPAAAPVALGDRLFVPLTDGTVLLPSQAWFRPTVLGFPVGR